MFSGQTGKNHKQDGRISNLLIIIGAVTLFLVFSMVLIIARSGKSNPGGKAFTQALAKSNGEATYAMLTDRLKEKVGDQEQWSKIVSEAFETTDPKFKQESDTPIENLGNTYNADELPERITYDVTTSTGKNYKMYIIVVKENGSYKVDEFDTYTK